MCCGAKSRTSAIARGGFARGSAQIAAPAIAQRAAAPAQVQFEYTGKTKMTVLSPLTGIRYQFDAPGATATVDARDQGMLIHVPGLRPVRLTRNA